MRLIDFLDKGRSLGERAPCLTLDGRSMSYGDVADLSVDIAHALVASGVTPGAKVAVLSSNDPIAFTCVFGISRAGAVWCPINPRNEAAENREQLDLFDTECLIYQAKYAGLVEAIIGDLPRITTVVCLDPGTVDPPVGVSFDAWLDGGRLGRAALPSPVDDTALIAGTGGTTGRPKGVEITGHNLETMSAITLMSYPFSPRPVYLAFAPLTHAAGVLCFPVMAMGGEIVIMAAPDVDALLTLVPAHGVTHLFLPPTVIYLMLDHPDFDSADLSSVDCLWYGAAPMSATRLEEAVLRIGPVMAQLYGQTEAPMMISAMSPADHLRPDGTPAVERFASAGKPTPLVTVGIMGDNGELVPTGERGEIVVRGPLVMAGYYKNDAATADATINGWHRTGDIGFLDADNWLSIVDRAKDMIITGGYNVYSAEVEQALMAHEAIRDCAVIGLPDEKWGERVVAILELHANAIIEDAEVMAFVKAKVGAVKTPKQIEVWPDLPRSKVGKIVKPDIKAVIAKR